MQESKEAVRVYNKDNIILCLMELNGDENDKKRGTEDWTNLLDRGELWHVSDTAYNFFYAIEDEVCSHLCTRFSTPNE